MTRKEHWAGGLGGLGSHPGVATSLLQALGSPSLFLGSALPLRGLGGRRVPVPGLSSMTPMVPRLLMGDPVLTPGFLDSSSSALALTSLYLFSLGPSALSSCPSLFRRLVYGFLKSLHLWGMLCWRGVSLWLCLSGMTKPLSLLEAFQASVSSWGSAWQVGGAG